MADAISGTRKRGRPSTGAISLHVRVEPADLELLDLWIKANDPDLSRPEALRRILRMVAVRVPK